MRRTISTGKRIRFAGAAAPRVGAVVGARGEELVDQVALGAHDLDGVVARPCCASAGGCGEVGRGPVDARGRQRARPERRDRRLGRRGADARTGGSRSGPACSTCSAIAPPSSCTAPVTSRCRSACSRVVISRGERLEPAALVGRVAAGDDQPDPAAGALGEVRRQLGQVPGVVLEPGVHRAHHHAVAQRQVADRDRREQVRVVVVIGMRCSCVGLQVLGEPLDPELLLLGCRRAGPGTGRGRGRSGSVGSGVVARARAARSGPAGCGGRRRARRRRPARRARSPYDAPRIFTRELAAEARSRRGGRDPVGQRRSPTRVTAYTCFSGRPVWPTLGRHPAVALHPAQHLVDLLVGGAPEEPDRAVEPAGQLEPGRRVARCSETRRACSRAMRSICRRYATLVQLVA